MHPLQFLNFAWAMILGLSIFSGPQPGEDVTTMSPVELAQSADAVTVACDCEIHQGSNTYPISALLGNETDVQFYSYGNPDGASANTGLELENTLVLFFYQDTTTGIVSLFMIADIANSGTGGTMEAEINCLPDEAVLSVGDEPGEFFGAPPLMTGDWAWTGCCTDGGAIGNIGCGNSFNLDLLASSGIDSIVWLTGDINNPEHIVLSMSGESLWIDCGGGVCCPVGFDTQVTLEDASCPDTPDGSISLEPQDGTPNYTFSWSTGATTQSINGLLPGTYLVTITDSQGCTDELEVEIGVSPGIPPANPAAIEICSAEAEDYFDLTSVEGTVDQGGANSVLWFTDMGMGTPIADPANYLSGTATVYAVVDNGSCLSEPVPVDLTLLPSPVANPATLSICEVANGEAVFDLLSLENTVSGGVGTIIWYQDAGLTDVILDPSNYESSGGTIYAVIDDDQCLSEPVEITLEVYLLPEAFPAELHACGDEYDEAVFDITLLEIDVGSGNGLVEWYVDVDLSIPIDDPTAYQTLTTTVYATVFDGTCYSDPVAIDLVVDSSPQGNPVTAQICDDGSGQGEFNLWDYENEVSGGGGSVTWYYDESLLTPILSPGSFLTESTTIYATVDDGTCVSDPVPVTLEVIISPTATSTFLETCGDFSGIGVFDLTDADQEISGGIGIVLWFEDAQGNVPIADPTAYATPGTTVYAQVTLGDCSSELVPVDLNLVNSVSVMPADYENCDNGSGEATFDLTSIDDEVNGGSGGNVNWFWDSLGTLMIADPQALTIGDTVVYANVVAGSCVSDIVEITLLVLPSPVATGTTLALCGDENGVANIDLTAQDSAVSNDIGSVNWFADATLGIPIADPAAFQAGDTTVYATVSLGDCESDPVAVDIFVSVYASANPDSLQLCVDEGDTLSIDLTQLDMNVSEGAGAVNWYSDPATTVVIDNPAAYQGWTTVTVYATVSSGVCESAAVPVGLEILSIPEANPFSFKKCGDTNGEATFNLTVADPAISGNTGTVIWYANAAATDSIGNPQMYTSGDGTVYAVVVNDFCVSGVVGVTLEVVDSLTANPASIEECVVNDSAAVVDLTQADLTIGGGSDVFWFSDVLATDTLADPSAYSTSGDTVYAVVAADGCVSEPVAIPVVIAGSAYPEPDCAFTSIDSIGFIWLNVADSYELSITINGMTIVDPWITQSLVFGISGLDQGDTVTLSVSALYDSICPPLTQEITCITDVCPVQDFDISGLKPEYCRDEDAVSLNAIPAGGQFSGDGVTGNTFDPGSVAGTSATITYRWSDAATGCDYDTSVIVQIYEPLASPEPSCGTPSLSSVTINWTDVAGDYEYMYTINQGAIVGPTGTTATSILVDNLQEGDEVMLMVWSAGSAPCGNSDTASITCTAISCPDVTLSINDPGTMCSGFEPVQLVVDIQGLPGAPEMSWSGPGIIDPSGVFDPSAVDPGPSGVSVTVEDPGTGCKYNASTILTVIQTPDSYFDVAGVPCVDGSLQLIITGDSPPGADILWDLSGGEVVDGSYPYDFSVQWPMAGDYTVRLVVDDNGCVSEPGLAEVSIDAPLDAPAPQCDSVGYYSVTVSWPPVAGASSYSVSSAFGSGTISGTTATLRGLPDNTPVDITITASGNSACGPSTATIECITEEYIPAGIFVPNVFTPNGDGVNDVIFVHANSRVSRISEFRIFDRWGELLYEDFNFLPNDPAHGWDGKSDGVFMTPAVFVYTVKYITVDGLELVEIGDVTLLR